MTQHVANIGALNQEQNLIVQSSMAESKSNKRMHSEGAGERDHLITFEEAAITPCKKTNLPSEVVDESLQAPFKPKKKKRRG